MALPIHAYFGFYTSSAMYDEYLDFQSPEKIQSFQGGPSAFHHNGINFIDIEPEDIEENAESATDYTYDFVMWNREKIFSPHSLTLAAPDPTVGNRLTGCPVIQKRLADVDTCITQVGHSILLDVVFQSFNATGNFVTLRLKTPISASSIEAGEAFCLSRSIPGDSVFTGLGAKQYDLSGTIEEWSGAVTSFNGLTIVIQLSATPTTPGNLSEVTCIAPNNQKMWIVPLGRVVSNADNYTATPVALNVPEWTYMDKTTNTIGPFTCISPKINTVYAAIGDMLKYFIIIERSPGFQPYDNGFKIIPTLIVY